MEAGMDLIDAYLAKKRSWFLGRVDRSNGESACWPWTGWRHREGYGGVLSDGLGSRSLLAHRVAYVIAYGHFDSRLCVCHRCDNPPCCNPTHLFLGTIGDNNRDKARKGRGVAGDKHPARLHPERLCRGEAVNTAKLSSADVESIRLRVASGERSPALAREFGVHPATVRRVVAGTSWSHLTERRPA